MKKRLVSVLCILSILILWLPPVEVSAASDESEILPINTSGFTDEWVTEGLSGIRAGSADEALALLRGGSQAGIRSFGASKAALTYTLKDTVLSSFDQSKAYKFQQTYNGVPIFGMVRIVNTDRDGYVHAISGDCAPDIVGMSLDTSPVFNAAQAETIAIADRGLTRSEFNTIEYELVYYMMAVEGKPLYHLTYRVVLCGRDEAQGFFSWVIMVDAMDGTILDREDRIDRLTGAGDYVWGKARNFTCVYEGGEYIIRDPDRNFQTWDMGWGTSNGYPITSDTTDFGYTPGADGAYFAQKTYDFYYNNFGRRGMTGSGNHFDVMVGYGYPGTAASESAFQSGSQLVFGSGNWDEDLDPYDAFVDLCTANDVVAHEYTHGVIEHSAELVYHSISGALNEAIADIMGTLAEGKSSSSEGFYLMGEDAMIYYHVGLRSLKNPGAYGLPSTMNEYVHTTQDEGGVHINMGIPSKAFYTMSRKISTTKLAQIWYGALTQYLTNYSDFWDARNATVEEAQTLYGSSTAKVVAAAWDSVGVYAESPDLPGDSLAMAIALSPNTTRFESINWGGDRDFYKLTPANSAEYVFSTTGNTDTYGFLYNAGGRELRTNNDYSGRNFRIQYSLEGGQTYYLLVRHYNKDYGYGDYTLNCTADIPALSDLTVTSSKVSPQEINTKVTFTAQTGYQGAAEYRVEIKESGSTAWLTVQPYEQKNTYEWSPTKIGSYDIRISARAVDRTNDADRVWTTTYQITDITPQAGVSLSSSMNPGEKDAAVTFTATPQGAQSLTSRARYQFRLKQGSKWTTVQPWSAGNTYRWTPTKTGTYALEVQSRTDGRTTVDGTDRIDDFQVAYPPELGGVELAAAPETPSERNTAIVLTATPSGDQSYRAEYLFRVKAGKSVSTLHGWGPVNTYTWRPTKTGSSYIIEVQARTHGRTSVDTVDSMDYTVVDIYPLDEVKLSSSKPGMQPAETEIRLSAAAQGPHAAEAQYLYQYSTDGKKWRSIGDGKWTDSPWAMYTPKSDVVYQFRVQARSPGRSGVDVSDTISQRFYIGPMPVEDVSLTVVEPADIQETGKIVELTAAAQGEAADDAEYLYRVKLGKKWTTVRDWDSEKDYDWKPEREGNYTIEVQARTQGRKSPDAVADTPYRVVNVFPLTGVTLTGMPSGMQEAGTEITLNAVAEGPYADNAEYMFQYSLDGKKWYGITKVFGPDNEITYKPTKEAVYRFRVQARSAGRSGVDTEDMFSQRFYVGTMPVESVSLEIEPPGTQEIKRTATLRATAHGDAAANAEFLFRVKLGKKWTTVRDWGDTPTYPWTPDKTGTYTVEVQARNRDRKGTDAVDTVAAYMVVLPPPLNGVTLRADRQTPQETKTGIILTAGAEGNESETSRAQYLFRVKLGSRWTTLQGWGPNAICPWTPDKTGTYTVEVQARTAGRPTTDVNATISPYVIELPDELTSVELTASTDSPQKIKTSIELNAAAKIGEVETGRAEYLFRAKLGSKWTTLRSWGAGTYTWEPTKTGKYTIEVQARTVGRPSTDVKATMYPYEIELPDALTSVELSASEVSPAKTGSGIILSAKGKIGEAEADNAQYLFRVKLGKSWSTLQNWSEEASYTWKPTKTGTYTIEVQARTLGRSAADVKATISPYVIELPEALTSVELSTSETSPAETGTGITLSAKGTIGDAEADNAQYLFRVKLGKSWSTLQNWSEEASYTWKPTKTGTYTIEVQARTLGRSAADVKATMYPYEVELPDALTNVELSASEVSPAKTGTGIILSAKGTIGDAEAGHAQYLFRVKLGKSWSTLKNWSEEASYTWEPTKTGTYTIEVQARTIGRPTADVKATMYPYVIELPKALTEVELTASAIGPQEIKTSIEFSATAKIDGIEADHAQYLFRVKLGKRWSTLKNWSEEASYTWEPNKTGAYIIEVQARTTGRSAVDANQTMAYTITGIVPVSSVAIIAEPEYGVVDESTTITAAADRPNAEYRFLSRQAEGPYELLQEWSGDADCEWTPEAAGEYTLLVMSRARQQNSVQAVQTYDYRVLAVAPVSEVTVDVDPKDGQELGGTVEITAQADQPDAYFEFAYSLDGGGFIEAQGFSSDASCTWKPDATGVYTWRVRARTDDSFPQGQAEALATYRVYTEVTISDAALRDGLKNILGKTPDDIVTNLDMATLIDLDCSGWGIEDLAGIEYAVNIVNLDLSENRIQDLVPLQTLIDNGGLAETGSQLDIALNGLDAREGTPVKSIFDAWTDAGIELAYLPQHPIVGNVTLITDIESPGDAGTVIQLTAQSDQPGVEYRFSVDEDILLEWTDADTLVWMPDTAGVFTIMVQARTWGMPETEVTGSIQYEILPAPLAAVSIGAVPDASVEEGDTVTLSAASEAGAWYRFHVMGEDGEWTPVGEDWSQSTSIEWAPENAGEFTLCVQAHRDGRPADSIDASDTMTYRVIPWPVTGDLTITVSPESPLEAGTKITMSVDDLGADAEYWFGVQNAEESWVWTGEWGAETSADWVPDSAGIYVLTARSRALGRDGYDLEATLIYTVTPPPVGAVSLTVEPESPHAIGTEVKLTAESEGSNPEYCFSIKAEDGDFEDIQEWTENKIVTWIPDVPGTYTLRVQARESGQSVATAEASTLSLVAWPSLESLDLGINETVTYQYEPRQLTATANTDYAEFKFTVQNPDGSWSTLQGWVENSACEWTPSAAGEYILQVEGRGLGRVGSDCSDIITIPVYPSPPMREWVAYFGGSGMDESKAVRQTNDGGYILAGYTRSTDVPGYKDPNGKSDAYLVKTDSMGSMQWQFCRGGDQNDVFRDVIETADGGFLAVGQKGISSDAYVFIVKVNAQGYLEWEDWYGGSGNSDAYAVSKTIDGKYCVTGYVCDTGLSKLSGLAGKKISTGVDGFILKMDGNGEPVWLKYYGGDDLDHLYDIIESSDGSLICVGKTRSTNLNNNYHDAIDGWVVKTNSSGTLQWQRAIGGSCQDCFYGGCIRYIGDQERYEMVGMTQSNDGDTSGYHGLSDGYFVSINSSGNTLYDTECFGGTKNDQLRDIFITNDQDSFLMGSSESKDGSLSNILGNGIGWILRLNDQNLITWQKRLYEVCSPYLEASLCETVEGNFAFTGYNENTNRTFCSLENSNLLLAKMSPEGVMMPFFAEMAFDRQSPQAVGTSITVTGISNLDGAEYRFLYYDEAGSETILQDWSMDATAEWMPNTAGLYVIKMQARIPQYGQYIETDIVKFNIQ